MSGLQLTGVIPFVLAAATLTVSVLAYLRSVRGDYVDQLEDHVRRLERENTALKGENDRLADENLRLMRKLLANGVQRP